MLSRLNLQQTNRPIDVVRHWRDAGDLELNTPYQRGDVWGKARRIAFMKSLLTGIPIPSVIINDRFRATDRGATQFAEADQYKYAVIDGKQRLTTILMFVDGELQLPGEWFDHKTDPDAAMVSGPDLTHVGLRLFSNRAMGFSEATLPSIEREREVFELVNFAGLQQGQVDTDI